MAGSSTLADAVEQSIGMPHLHNIVLADGADDPGIVGVPAEVRDLGGVATMDEEQLWGTVLRILGTLLLSNLAQVPNMESAVCAR